MLDVTCEWCGAPVPTVLCMCVPPLSDEAKKELVERFGIEFTDWKPTIPGRDD